VVKLKPENDGDRYGRKERKHDERNGARVTTDNGESHERKERKKEKEREEREKSRESFLTGGLIHSFSPDGKTLSFLSSQRSIANETLAPFLADPCTVEPDIENDPFVVEASRNSIEEELDRAKAEKAAKEAHFRDLTTKYSTKMKRKKTDQLPHTYPVRFLVDHGSYKAGDVTKITIIGDLSTCIKPGIVEIIPPVCPICGADTGKGHSSYVVTDGLRVCGACGPKMAMVKGAMKSHSDGISIPELYDDLSARGRPPRKEHLPRLLELLGCRNGDGDRWVPEAT
jgi:hypothetical protein